MPEQSLPRRPDLAQLRRQAKELRDALRGGEKGAIERFRRYSQAAAETVTLSAAQLVIAREHGFPSWPQLKERVETSVRPAESPDSLADSARKHRLSRPGSSVRFPRSSSRSASSSQSKAASWQALVIRTTARASG